MSFFKPSAATNAQIVECKNKLQLAVAQFSNQVMQGGFTEGTYENIMEARREELKEFNRLLDKVRWSIPKRLTKKIDAFTKAMNEASELRSTFFAYAICQSPIDTYQDARHYIPAEILEKFKLAQSDTIKHFHDLARRLMLQPKLADQVNEMKRARKRISVLHSYILDPLNVDKRHAVLDSIVKLEKIQHRDKQKAATGVMLRIVGWSIIIFATIIAINPAVGFTIVAISIALTILGELINLLGKKLLKPRVGKEELSSMHSTMLLFRQHVPVIKSKDEFLPIINSMQ